MWMGFLGGPALLLVPKGGRDCHNQERQEATPSPKLCLRS